MMGWDALEEAVWREVLKRALVEKTPRPLTEVQSYILDSCLQRDDLATAKQFLTDWTTPAPEKPGAYVSKWVPGSHYYALDTKFATLEQAREHLERNGHTYLGFKPVRITDHLR